MVARHRSGEDEGALAELALAAARDELAPTDDPPLAVVAFPVHACLTGSVVVTREPGCEPFAADELATLRTCVEYAVMALENAVRWEFQQYMLGVVGHDLKNPLASIHMGCDVIRRQLAGHPELEQMVARLHATSGRMQRIVDQLLDITRARLGTGIPVERRETDLDQLVGSVIDELSLAYPATRFESRLAPVRGAWDADRLAQVVSNLVGNAIQHGAAASPVWIETAPDGDDALIRVRNVTCGAPVAEAERALVFVPRPSKPSSSLGLGLYIADEILRAHRGRISIDATPSTTTFTVRLPLGPWSS